ncbi:MAG: hypothetical protein QF718_02465 [Phycisphaerales bacterium]|jgi:hypothetical protein|nr:hypothetical protein [Phycisphaerales bacterium]
MLAWIPFLEPMNLMQQWWYLLIIPMSLGISIIYRSIRETNYSNYWRSVVVMTIQIVFGIVGIAAVLGIFVQLVVPLLNQP